MMNALEIQGWFTQFLSQEVPISSSTGGECDSPSKGSLLLIKHTHIPGAHKDRMKPHTSPAMTQPVSQLLWRKYSTKEHSDECARESGGSRGSPGRLSQ